MVTEDEYEDLKREFERTEKESAARMREIYRLRGVVRMLEDEIEKLQQAKDAKNDEQTEK